MTNKEILKRKIIYRSEHRGTKEMDLLLGGFVKKYIHKFNDEELNDLENLITKSDESIFKWYTIKNYKGSISSNKVSQMLRKFKV